MSDPLGRPCVCGTMRIPTDQLSVTDTDTVHRHGGPCYVDESRSSDDVVQRARQALDGITERGIAWETRTEHRELARVVHSGEWEGSLSRCCDCGTEAGYPNAADARFIAAAPELVTDLLALVEELSAEQEH